MSKTKAEKIQAVVKLTEQINQAKAVVFTDYQQAVSAGSPAGGMTMKQLSDLRDQLRDLNAELIITKNTLLKKSVENLKLKIENSIFDGPTATLFAYDDEILPIKALVKALKDNGIGKVKAGYLGNQLLDEAKIKQLATLPSKDELRAKTVGVLVAPLQGILSVLQGNLRNLVYALEQIRKSRGGEA